MAPYESLYGRRCRPPLCWAEVGEKGTFGLKIDQETSNTIKMIQKKNKKPQDLQNSYANNRQRPLEF